MYTVEKVRRRHRTAGPSLPLVRLRERRFLRASRVVLQEERLAWYREHFGAAERFLPSEAIDGLEPIVKKKRCKVLRMKAGDGQPPAAGPSAGPSAGPPDSPLDRALIIKEEIYPFPTFFKGLFTRAPSAREFENLMALRALGFPAVEPLAYGCSGVGPLYQSSFLITREFGGATDLRDWVKERSGVSPEDVERRFVSLAAELAGLHARGFYLKTLYAKNLLVRKDANGGLDLALCDVPRLARRRGLRFSFRLAARDLASLEKWARVVFSPRARLRFLRRYLRALRQGPPPRVWLRRIRRRVERMRHRTFLGGLSKNFKRALRRRGLQNYWPF